jgi:hypothetical protein
LCQKPDLWKLQPTRQVWRVLGKKPTQLLRGLRFSDGASLLTYISWSRRVDARSTKEGLFSDAGQRQVARRVGLRTVLESGEGFVRAGQYQIGLKMCKGWRTYQADGSCFSCHAVSHRDCVPGTATPPDGPWSLQPLQRRCLADGNDGDGDGDGGRAGGCITGHRCLERVRRDGR